MCHVVLDELLKKLDTHVCMFCFTALQSNWGHLQEICNKISQLGRLNGDHVH